MRSGDNWAAWVARASSGSNPRRTSIVATLAATMAPTRAQPNKVQANARRKRMSGVMSSTSTALMESPGVLGWGSENVMRRSWLASLSRPTGLP
ncbi:hypothetical protein D3C71_1351360 [compost metagenome]